MENILFSTFLQDKSENDPTSVSILVYDKLISFSNVVEDSHHIQAVNVHMFMIYFIQMELQQRRLRFFFKKKQQ